MKNLCKKAELECPLALLTNFDIPALKKIHGTWPTGVFHRYFDKEDCLANKTFRDYVQECRTLNSPNEEKLTASLDTIKEMKLEDASADLLIDQNETTFSKVENEFEVLKNWNTVGDLCSNRNIFKDLPHDIQKIILDRVRQFIKKNREIGVINS